MFQFLLFLVVGLISVVHSNVDFYDGLVNARVQVASYITSPVAKILVTVEIKNTGDKPANTYFVAIPRHLVDNLSAVEAIDSNSNSPLRVSLLEGIKFSKNYKSDTPANSAIYYSIPLPKTLAPNSDEILTIKLTIAYVHMLNPLPAEIRKSGKQYVTYENNRYFYSPYRTEKMGVKFTLASDKIKSYTKPATVKDRKITYGPYQDISPLAISKVKFHYQFHVPFLTMTQVSRDMEVSHWGNVRIEESFNLRHDGAKLKGAYEPGVMDRRFGSGDPSVVTELRATLPKRADNVYYVDRIGNVSTSHFRTGNKASYLEIRPRYPLYGGWKTDFIIGYDVPSHDLISFDPSTFEHVLNVSFGIPFKEPVTDLVVTTIALPEGAHDIEIDCPYDIELFLENVDGSPMRRFTYLDTRLLGGRPLIQFYRKNVINLHNKYFQVRYKYDKNRIYFKPVLIISGIFVFLFTISVFSRIRPALEDEKEQTVRRESLLEHAPEIQHAGKQSKGGSKHGSHHSSHRGSTVSSSYGGGGGSSILDAGGARDALRGLDTNASSANHLYKQLKNIREQVRRGNDENLKQKVNEAYNRAKKHKDDKKKIAKYIDDLRSNI